MTTLAPPRVPMPTDPATVPEPAAGAPPAAGEWAGWIFYDGRCPICARGARRFGGLARALGYRTVPLQRRWVAEKLGKTREQLMDQMHVLTAGGEVYRGIDGFCHLADQTWWAKPAAWVARIPPIRRLLERGYAWFATNRYCVADRCGIRRPQPRG